MPGCPLIGSEGERGGWASERNGWRRWCAIMVMKAAILEGDQPRWWWGVMRRGCSSRYGSGSGTHAREAAVATVGPGRKTIGQGPRVSRAPPRASREVKAQWGEEERVSRRPMPRRLGQKPELGPIREIKPFRILFGTQIFSKLLKFIQGNIERILT
jgi:hypothetical protein